MPASMPSVSGILETSLYVEDLARSRTFYETVFGFPVLLYDERMCSMAVAPRQVLLLFRRGGSTEPSMTPFGPIPAHNGRGAQHLCFSVAPDSLGLWRTHLLARGIRIESDLLWPAGRHSLYFRDPDEHSLEVATPGLWLNDPLTKS